jgi:hypothetical protein
MMACPPPSLDTNKRKRSSGASAAAAFEVPDAAPASEYDTVASTELPPDEVEPTQDGYVNIGWGNAGFVSTERESMSSKTTDALAEAISMAPSGTPLITNLELEDTVGVESQWQLPTDEYLSALGSGYCDTPRDLPYAQLATTRLLFAAGDPLFEGTGSTTNSQCVMYHPFNFPRLTR